MESYLTSDGISNETNRKPTSNGNDTDCDPARQKQQQPNTSPQCVVNMQKNISNEKPTFVKTDTVESSNGIASTNDQQTAANKSISGEEGKVLLSGNTSASLSNLLVYSSDDSSTSDEDEEELEVVRKLQANAIRIDDSSSSSDDSDGVYRSDDDDSSSSEGELELRNDVETPVVPSAGCRKKDPKMVKSKGEMSVDDLPPVPDISTLNINVPEDECIVIGSISGIVGQFVIVDSLPNIPPLDLDTLLFLSSGARPLGRIFDVMGPVSAPLYVVRFNKDADIRSYNVHEGMPVYSAPNTEYTQFVFVKHLMQMKGSDASWVDDNEVPEEFIDFSDDEQESMHRLGTKGGTRKRGSLERHRTFEKEMNARNAVDTAKRNLASERKQQQQQTRREPKGSCFSRGRGRDRAQKVEARTLPAPGPMPNAPNMMYNMPYMGQYPAMQMAACPEMPFYAANYPPPCMNFQSPFAFAAPAIPTLPMHVPYQSLMNLPPPPPPPPERLPHHVVTQQSSSPMQVGQEQQKDGKMMQSHVRQ